MVAVGETISESGPWPAARACRVTATYPQGGTGIPAGEMNYPGAAVQSRCLGTGFHAVDATSGFGLSPNALNINGANTYQFVGSGPVGRVDPSGMDTVLVTDNFHLGWWATFHVVVREKRVCPNPSLKIVAQYWTGFQTVPSQRYTAVVVPFGSTITKGPCVGGKRVITDLLHFEVKTFVTIGLWRFGLTVPAGTYSQWNLLRVRCDCCGSGGGG